MNHSVVLRIIRICLYYTFVEKSRILTNFITDRLCVRNNNRTCCETEPAVNSAGLQETARREANSETANLA